MKIRFFHLPKPRQFAIQSRYAEKEKDTRLEPSNPDLKYIRKIDRGMFKKTYKGTSATFKKEKQKANKRLLIIISALFALLYFLLQL